MIFGGGNPATATTEIIDISAADAAVAVRPVDVAAADRDERDDPAERQSAGDGRIGERRGRGNRELERGSVRPDDEHVQLGGRERVSAPVSFRVAAPAGCDRDAGRRKPDARQLRAADRDLLARVSVQRGRHPAARPAITGVTPARSATANVPGPDTRCGEHRVGRPGSARAPRRTRSTWTSGWSGCRLRRAAAC